MDPHHVNADQDQGPDFHFHADPAPRQSNGNLWPVVYRPSRPLLGVLGFPLPFFDPLKLQNFDSNAEPDPDSAFNANAGSDPDPVSKNSADPDPQSCCVSVK